MRKNLKNKLGFTLVELAIVVVVIAIIAAISYVSYSKIQTRARVAQLSSELSNAYEQLGLDKSKTGKYPASLSAVSGGAGLKISANYTVNYYYSATTDYYCLSAYVTAYPSLVYYVNKDTNNPTSGSCPVFWKTISVGNSLSCGIAMNDQEYCWGGYAGSNGVGAANSKLIPTQVIMSGNLVGKSILAVSGHGQKSSCSIASDLAIYCTGDDFYGQLGDNSTTQKFVLTPVDNTGVLSGKTALSVESTLSHTCTLASDSQVYCWGNNATYQLGNNSSTNSLVPVSIYTSGVLSGLSIKSLSIGQSYSCVIASDNKAYCWGFNYNYQLGDGTNSIRAVPTAVYNDGVLKNKNLKSISAGLQHTCVISTDDKVYCWGTNSSGQLGNNSTVSSSVPVVVDMSGVLSGKSLKTVIANDSNSTCVIAMDGSAYCWGDNTYGQLGDGTTINRLTPIALPMSGLLANKTVKSLSISIYHTCLLASDSQIYCYGHGNGGVLGINDYNMDSLTPQKIFSPF